MSVDRTRDLQIFSLTLSQLSYPRWPSFLLQKQSIPLTKQVDYYVQVHEEMAKEVGAAALQVRLAKSIFGVVIGSNDLFGYLSSSNRKSTPEQYVNSMAFTLKAQLKVIVSSNTPSPCYANW